VFMRDVTCYLYFVWINKIDDYNINNNSNNNNNNAQVFERNQFLAK